LPSLGSMSNPNLVAERSQRLAHQLLVGERAVDLGGVEEVDPTFKSRPDKRDSLLLVDRGTVAVAQSHAAQSDGRNLESAVSKRALLHVALTFIDDDSKLVVNDP